MQNKILFIFTICQLKQEYCQLNQEICQCDKGQSPVTLINIYYISISYHNHDVRGQILLGMMTAMTQYLSPRLLPAVSRRQPQPLIPLFCRKTPSLSQVKTSIKRVKSRMQFELFRAKEVKSKAQSEQTTSERQETASLTI